MKKLLALVILVLISPYTHSSGSEATVGDFGTNQQAETITTTTETTVNQEGMPVTTAVAPSTPTYQTDTCIVTSGSGVQTLQIGISTSKMKVDENCERIKLAKVLQDFGMKVASVAVLCQDKRVFSAMEAAGTPCPYSGLIGPQAAEMWEKYPELRPDYEEHLAKEQVVARVNAEIVEQERIEAERIAAEEAEAARIEAERLEQELLTLKEKDEVNDIEPVIDPVPVNVHSD